MSEEVEIRSLACIGYPMYDAYSDGRIYSKYNNIFLRACADKLGYKYLNLCNDEGKKHFSVHYLIASAFKCNPNDKETIDHIDRNPSNNNKSNLRGATQSEQNLNQTRNSEIRGRAVYQLDIKTTEILAKYISITQATKAVNLKSSTNISDVCKGKRKTSAGYKWKYADIIIELPGEIFKPLNMYADLTHLEVSNYGRIRHINDKHLKHQHLGADYYRIATPDYRVHILVARAFLGERPKGYIINHIDGNKLNNCLENLEYRTQSYNIYHANKLGLVARHNNALYVTQLDLEGNFIKTYNSAREAAKGVGLSLSVILKDIKYIKEHNNEPSPHMKWIFTTIY